MERMLFYQLVVSVSTLFLNLFFSYQAHYTPLFQNVMKSICMYYNFKSHIHTSASETEDLKKKFEESKVEKALLRGLMAQQENELLLSGQRQSLLEIQASEANSQIQGLEAQLMASKENSKRLEEDHSIIKEDLKQLKEKFIEVDLQCTTLLEHLQEAKEEASVQHMKAEEAAEKWKANKTKVVRLKAKFKHVKRQLDDYKEKALNYFRQLSFASWAKGWARRYAVGFETFPNLIFNPSMHINIDMVSPDAFPPKVEAIEELLCIVPKQMPDARGITKFGYWPAKKSSKHDVTLGNVGVPKPNNE